MRRKSASRSRSCAPAPSPPAAESSALDPRGPNRRSLRAMNRRIWAVAALALALACGGKDESAAFVGPFPGLLSPAALNDGIRRTVVIERAGNNELTISGLCDAPISADVESATTFSFGPVRNCLTSGTSCNSSQLSLDGGEGQLTL